MPECADGLALYAAMVRVRRFEEEVAARYRQQRMPTPVHLYLGEEACAAGVCLALAPRDRVFTTHRSHGHYLAKGGDMGRLAGELHARPWGCSHGRGGSMHVCDPEAGVNGATAIVGGSIPLAVGAALGDWIRGEDRVSVTFFGDGAADEGVIHEALNFAVLRRLAVVFVCENNLYATCSHRTARQAFPDVAALAEPYGIPTAIVDGNDAPAVLAAARLAVARARAGEGPSFLECRTYRWRGHVGPECDAGMGYRSLEEIESWRARCPVARLRAALIAADPAVVARLDALDSTANEAVLQAFAAAEAGLPDVLAAYDGQGDR